MTDGTAAPGAGACEHVVVVLGSPNDDAGNLSPMAVERLRRGAEEFFAAEGLRVLLTGGAGPHFNRTSRPHAEYARTLLLSLGVPEEAFAEFALSGNTIEDALLAKPIVDRLAARSLVVVTSDFHLERARYVFDRVFPELERSYVAAVHEGGHEPRSRAGGARGASPGEAAVAAGHRRRPSRTRLV